jgi:tetratricopeptide (TPR) repeat protein
MPSTDSRSAGGESLVRGQISSVNRITEALSIELSVPGRGITANVDVDGGGAFEVRGLPSNVYQLRVVGTSDRTVYTSFLTITGGYQNLTIDIPAGPETRSGPNATTSIQQLSHQVPTAARKEFDKGETALRKGDPSDALAHYQNATRIDPEFADAFNGAGASEMALDQLQPAADELQKAIDLVPDHAQALANLSIALCVLGHYHQVLQVARRALRLNPTLLNVRYALGLSLVRDNGDLAEALDNLKRAAPAVPKAHLLAANVLATAGRRKEAAEQISAYLASASSEAGVDRKKVKEWLEQLR